MSEGPSGKIAFQGVAAAHSDVVCRQLFPDKETMPLPSFEDVFEAVRDGRAEIGLLPIENSQAGRVAEIHFLIPKMQLYITGEYFQHIRHYLLGPKGAQLKQVQHVYSHPQALIQCRKNLRALGVETHGYADTALAAYDVSQWNDPSRAAVASDLAGQLYDLDILKPNLEDSPENMTLFVSVCREPIDPAPETGRIITSILFITRNIPAALYKALGGFATNKINLLKLESYIPGKTSQTAQFFVTFEGHPRDHLVRLALEELQFFCESVTVLGSYYADPIRFS